MKNETLFYLVRHAESESNLAEKMSGHYNVALTPDGHRQAELCAEFFALKPLDAIYSSDLDRALDTAIPTARRTGLGVSTDSRLREINAGAWENRPFSELYTEYPEDMYIWRNDIGKIDCPGGEDASRLLSRIREALNMIDRITPGGRVAVFTHALPIRALCNHADGCSVANMQRMEWPPNASVSIVGCTGGIFRLYDYAIDTAGTQSPVY